MFCSMFFQSFLLLLVVVGISDAIIPTPAVLVVGSINADLFIPLDRLPESGENVVAKDNDGRYIAGGKGANTAVSCSRLGIPTLFCCMFGDDDNAKMLRHVMMDNKVDISTCQQVEKPSGTGLVFLQEDGSVSAVVLGGSNLAWPTTFDAIKLIEECKKGQPVACIMLQMEVPHWVNEAVAVAAEQAGIPVFQDVGGAERPISSAHLKRCTFLSPNLSELKRLSQLPVTTEDEILLAAQSLQQQGAHNVLVTMGSQGSMLLTESGQILKQPCMLVQQVVDETGAGDNYRAAFVVSHYVEKKSLQESMQFAAASGAVAVMKLGAIPSCSTREECLAVLSSLRGGSNNQENIPTEETKGGDDGGAIPNGGSSQTGDKMFDLSSQEEKFPFKFASRLNSMKDRPDLWMGEPGVVGWIKRQGQIKGLDLIDFNYPQHITSPKVTPAALAEIKDAMVAAGLQCGAICLRFPKEMQLGAFTNPHTAIRQQAIDMTKQACDWALALGANEVVVWSAFDGYDYALQVNYDSLWDNVVMAFQEICDAYPKVKVSLEYKPTDENTRFFAVPSTGAACVLMRDIDRGNFGLTLDFGHCLMAGENPAQAVAMVGKESRRLHRRPSATGRDHEDGFTTDEDSTSNKLFGVQLGDGYGRLGAEDGLAFGSIHPSAALEFVLWLIKTDFKGHIYFDTFPRNEDPVRECEYNIRQFKSMYYRAQSMLKEGLEGYWSTHDAMGILERYF